MGNDNIKDYPPYLDLPKRANGRANMKQNGNMAESDWWEKFRALADMVNSNSVNKQSPQTNADRIRAMSDEEMADYLEAVSEDSYGGERPLKAYEFLDWLKQEASDG